YLYSFGSNIAGQLGDGTQMNNQISPELIAGMSNDVSGLAAATSHSLAIRNGIVYSWGSNSKGELGQGTASPSSHLTPVPAINLSSVSQIAGGGTFSLALSNGVVYSWGANSSGQLGDGTMTDRATPMPIGGLANVSRIDAGI